ncbi:lipoyl(octanoyl) transferase LipB [Pontibacter russatus]|uniref:lipoyl(octanoyl) transferase LipB n=1 Tax=Pontibacter russatus TaxID=2694929 RepID=UPI00137A807D|nr:lipoyl(octanoyl) transferase LipB [Pontibacter russatus]
MDKNTEIKFGHLGLIDYQEAWEYQEKIFNSILELKAQNRKAEGSAQQPTPNYLLFCSHPHVYTLGKSGHEAHLLLSEEGLKEKGATYYKINRGGDITYHGPGQLVGYPILDLENFFTDIHKYLRYLEEAVIRTLAEYRVEAGRIPGLTGVWLDHERQLNPRKICAMGVKCSRWVTMHGFALNINTDLDYFNNIVPCGISDKQVTSLAKELGHEVDMAEVEEKLQQHLAQQFGATIITAAHEERH